jgi:hypothetical protein
VQLALGDMVLHHFKVRSRIGHALAYHMRRAADNSCSRLKSFIETPALMPQDHCEAAFDR